MMHFIKETKLNCEQCGEQYSGRTNMEEHRTIIHDSPKEVYSRKQINSPEEFCAGKQVNVSSNISEAKIKSRKNMFQNELQIIAEKEIKQFNYKTETAVNICQNELQYIAEKEVEEKQFNNISKTDLYYAEAEVRYDVLAKVNELDNFSIKYEIKTDNRCKYC